MWRLTLWLVALAWVGAVVGAREARAETPDPAPVVAVTAFSSNPAAQSQAAAVEALVGSQLAEAKELKVITQSDISTLLGIERQKQMLGVSGAECTDSCMTELAGAVGARFVVSGRVDRFGDAYILTTNLFDAQAAKALVKAQADAPSEAAIPSAVRQVTQRIVNALVGRKAADPASAGTAAVMGADSGNGVAAAVPKDSAPPAGITDGAKSASHKFSLGLLVGNSLIASIQALNFSGDLEFGWRFEREWVAFLQVGTTLVRQEQDLLPARFALVPSALGVRHLYRVDSDFQPYWGLGLGIQLAIGDFAFFGKTGPLPSVFGFVGFQYLVTEHFGVGVEGSTNLAQTMLGLTGDNRGTGFNLDLSGVVGWRF